MESQKSACCPTVFKTFIICNVVTALLSVVCNTHAKMNVYCNVFSISHHHMFTHHMHIVYHLNVFITSNCIICSWRTPWGQAGWQTETSTTVCENSFVTKACFQSCSQTSFSDLSYCCHFSVLKHRFSQNKITRPYLTRS